MSVDAILTEDGDFLLDSNGDILTSDFFDTAIRMSLFGSDRRATENEMPIAELRRGWIGDEDEEFLTGSKLWLYDQERITRDVLIGIQTETLKALNWLIEFNIAINIEASTAAISASNILLNIEIERPNSKVDRRYYELWNNTGVLT